MNAAPIITLENEGALVRRERSTPDRLERVSREGLDIGWCLLRRARQRHCPIATSVGLLILAFPAATSPHDPIRRDSQHSVRRAHAHTYQTRMTKLRADFVRVAHALKRREPPTRPIHRPGTPSQTPAFPTKRPTKAVEATAHSTPTTTARRPSPPQRTLSYCMNPTVDPKRSGARLQFRFAPYEPDIDAFAPPRAYAQS